MQAGATRLVIYNKNVIHAHKWVINDNLCNQLCSSILLTASKGKKRRLGRTGSRMITGRKSGIYGKQNDVEGNLLNIKSRRKGRRGSRWRWRMVPETGVVKDSRRWK